MCYRTNNYYWHINQSVVAYYGAKPEHSLEHKYHEKVRLQIQSQTMR